MRKRQKGNRKKGKSSRHIDHRDQDWLTPSERFTHDNSGPKSDKRHTNKNVGPIQQPDVNLCEYADNPKFPLTNRVSKAKTVTALHKDAKMESIVKTEEDDVVDDWFLQDDMDLDYQEESPDEDIHDQDDKDTHKVEDDDFTLEYPSDIWYILSNYISPLQVGCFACICKDAYMVTTTAAFWKRLYQRFYNPDVKLPVELQPFSMSRTHRIRSLVIRALYIMYEPYILRNKSNQPVEDGLDSPECLINRTCIFMWSRGQVGGHYYHFFKFRALETSPPIMNGVNDDAFYNLHEDECILKVFCHNFQHFPSDKIMGLTLVNISVSVSSNFRYHRLKLQFSRGENRRRKGQQRGRYREADLLSVVLDPVILVRVIHWWNHQFHDCLSYGTTSTVLTSNSNAMWDGRV